MRFTDGFWLVREGVSLGRASGVHEVETAADSVTAHAPVRPVRHRGDTLYGPLLGVRLGAPAPGVVSVEVTHFAGDLPRGPEFEVAGGPAPDVRVERDGDGGGAELFSGDLSARVAPGSPFGVEFRSGGRTVTRIGERGVATATDAEGVRHVVVQLDLGVGEHVYGMGERFSPLVRNGQSVDVWNQDGGTSSEQAYKNVPFYLTDAGYGVFVDHPGAVSFEVASENVSRAQFSVPGGSVRFLVVGGGSPAEVLRRYTALTGRPALPPAWSFGLWMSTSFTTDYDEATVGGFVDGMAERGIPLSVVHFDCFWMREYRWCDFVWDPRVFPDPEGMLRRLHERGLKVCVWINPYVSQRSALFEEGRRNGYLLRRPDGSVWQWDLWQPGMALVDFTNPAAREWFAGHLGRLLDQGVDCFKTDFGERVPTDVAWHDGSDPERMHNYYTHLYNRTVFDLLRERRGEGEAVVFARSATAGGQQFPVHWGGDCTSTFPSMAETLRGGLSLALSGFGFWSHDIGGFEGTPEPAVFKRWCAFGMLSSHSRLHGSDSYRVPWAFDEEAVAVLRAFTLLKNRLMPTLYAAAVEAHATGVPVMRPMVLSRPQDPTCSHLDRQYTLGPDLLVAPVMDRDGEVTYYLPTDGLGTAPGSWTDLIGGSRHAGGWVRERHGVMSLPLLLGPGGALVLGDRCDRPDYDYAAAPTLVLQAPPDGTRRRVPVVSPHGEEVGAFEVEREGDVLTVTGGTGDWSLHLLGTGAEPDGAGTSLGTVPLLPEGELLRASGPRFRPEGGTVRVRLTAG